MGTRYMRRGKLLNAVCDVLAETRRAQRIAPALMSMCEENGDPREDVHQVGFAARVGFW